MASRQLQTKPLNYLALIYLVPPLYNSRSYEIVIQSEQDLTSSELEHRQELIDDYNYFNNACKNMLRNWISDIITDTDHHDARLIILMFVVAIGLTLYFWCCSCKIKYDQMKKKKQKYERQIAEYNNSRRGEILKDEQSRSLPKTSSHNQDSETKSVQGVSQ